MTQDITNALIKGIMTEAARQQVIEPQHQIEAYNPFRNQIAEMKAVNAKTVFNYADPAGNKSARSYIAKLRTSKAEIERVREREKAFYLQGGRAVDAEAKALTAEIDAMISVHKGPLDEIENEEKQRVDLIQRAIQGFKNCQECKGQSSQQLNNCLKDLREIRIDHGFGEYREEAERELKAAIEAQTNELAVALKREADQLELERLRKEAALRDQSDREEKMKAEAADKARLEEQQKGQKEIDDAKAKADQAVRDKEDADKRAAEAIEKERFRVAKEQADKAAEDAAREADKQHQIKIHNEIKEALAALDIGTELAEALIKGIRAGSVPHVKIVY